MSLSGRKPFTSLVQPERRSVGRANWRCDRVQRRKRRQFLKLFGTVDFRADWDFKKARRRAIVRA
jgi:hypothetical protein